MDQLSIVDGIGALAPVEQSPGEFLEIKGFLVNFNARESTGGVASPPAGKVAAYVAVAVVAGIGHEDFCPVVELGNAAGGRKEDHGQPCFAHIVAELGVHPAHVVVVRKDDVVKGIGIQEVIAQHLIQPDPVGMPSLLFVHTLHESVVKREVEQPRQAGGVTVSVVLSPLPIGQYGRVEAPLFATNVQMGIGRFHGAGPRGHEAGIGIRIGVHSNTTQSQVFDPP